MGRKLLAVPYSLQAKFSVFNVGEEQIPGILIKCMWGDERNVVVY